MTQVVDSTAAGDSFNVSFLAQELAGAALAARVIAGSGALVRDAID